MVFVVLGVKRPVPIAILGGVWRSRQTVAATVVIKSLIPNRFCNLEKHDVSHSY